MIRYIYTCLLVLITFCTMAQDRIWLDNGNPVQAKLSRAMDNKLEWVASDGIPRIYNRKRFLVVFAASGQFMVISELNENTNKAQTQIEAFYKSPPRNVTQDIIVKSVPLTVIAGSISYESDEVINYLTTDNNPASINKEEVAAVIYRDGRHEILRDVVDVAPLLALAHKDIEKKEREIVRKEQEKPKPQQEPVAVKQEKPAPPKEPAKPFLSDQEYKEYSAKGIRRVDEFTSYLRIIGDKSLKSEEKNKAVAQALSLFEPQATVAVSSAKGVKKYPVKEYLNRLKLLPYSKINITWNEVKYVSELKQEADGNYYGTIAAQQVFEGFAANGKVAYGDITKKNIRVKLESYQKTVDGKDTVNWQVLLGNIGVETTEGQ
ncbi:hypothetical protein [Dyadobacter luticola]|uniref:Uncharacterized protein n=1 Tax=Dyadobacter luticola TaxID=1979387 RepID=A0A5R9KNZ1_9BACT|nr:hypothetical protein [Dyadobacter luticola]TLU98001.1 hypothetical protein FEN17_24745 [Dyadobacter luticola]